MRRMTLWVLMGHYMKTRCNLPKHVSFYCVMAFNFHNFSFVKVHNQMVDYNEDAKGQRLVLAIVVLGLQVRRMI